MQNDCLTLDTRLFYWPKCSTMASEVVKRLGFNSLTATVLTNIVIGILNGAGQTPNRNNFKLLVKHNFTDSLFFPNLLGSNLFNDL